MTEDEIADIVSQAENIFNVLPGDVSAEVTYEITGTVTLATDGTDYDDEELISALQTSIAESLNVHESDVEITIDPETGVATYTIGSSTAEDTSDLQGKLSRNDILENISTAVTNILPEITEVPAKIFDHYNEREQHLLKKPMNIS